MFRGNKLGGIREAARLLGGLDMAAQEKVLAIIAKQDVALAERLRQNMVIFEDLQYLTVSMLQELLREIKLEDMGLALRIGSQKLRDHILNNISSRMKQDILDILQGPPQQVTKVQEAAERIMEVVRHKIAQGELVLDRTGSEEYV